MSRIVGNNAIKNKLCGDIVSDKLPHALIFEGAHGTGKHTLALHTAAALACDRRKTDAPLPCCECAECKKILCKNSPDVITVGCDGKATLGVDVIRALRTDVRLVPNDLDFKLYIIEDADKMTEQAQNALLLTLEEPPQFVRFILLCEKADLLLETIRSRAPVLRTEPVSCDDLDAYICANDRRAAQLRLSSPAEYAELIMAADHGIGAALEYLDPKVFAPVKENRALALDFCVMATESQGAKKALPLVSRFSQKRDMLAEQLECLSRAVTDLILFKKSEQAPLEFFSDPELCAELCDKVSIKFLFDLNSAVLCAIDSNKKNANVRLTLIKMLSDAHVI